MNKIIFGFLFITITYQLVNKLDLRNIVDQGVSSAQTQVNQNDVVQVVFRMSGSTGLLWRLAQNVPSALLLSSEENERNGKLEAAIDHERVGAHGSQTFEFTAISQGTATVTFNFSRGNSDPIQTFTVTIKIVGNS